MTDVTNLESLSEPKHLSIKEVSAFECEQDSDDSDDVRTIFFIFNNVDIDWRHVDRAYLFEYTHTFLQLSGKTLGLCFHDEFQAHIPCFILNNFHRARVCTCTGDGRLKRAFARILSKKTVKTRFQRERLAEF
ncbi:hypothetical protein HELRODRAFT_182997 [Helobdella robusta]|uniref:Uncharacterized protein n=1 Tax=Helobdella robusta TaxID=6412 RepID=T1FJ27_HELRO|nr:hypothetical protein HELRODRAFT_182997 [Helobdella robusta]ESN89986.1 hypothetical protein HELRODRAFT_182997 [Helobdella robusta]